MHLIFDFDGVLADSGAFVFERLKRVSANQDISSDELRELSSDKVLKSLKISIFKLPFLIYDIRSEFSKNIPLLKLVEGLKETLEILTASGYQLHILSSNSSENINGFLQFHKIHTYFLSITSLFTIFGKARGLRTFLSDNNIPTDEAMYIGDETRDIEAARDVKIKSCAVCWGYNSESVLKAFNPDLIARTPQDLISIVESIKTSV